MNAYLRNLMDGKTVITEERNTYHNDYMGKYNYLNLSGIYDRLIMEAAKCTHYASDLIIDIKCVEKALDNQESGTFFFGFRDMGIDHESFIDSRLESSGGDPGINYRRILALEVEFGERDCGVGYATCTLSEIWRKEE